MESQRWGHFAKVGVKRKGGVKSQRKGGVKTQMGFFDKSVLEKVALSRGYYNMRAISDGLAPVFETTSKRMQGKLERGQLTKEECEVIGAYFEMTMKEYYNSLGPEGIRASSYLATRIDRKIRGVPCEDDLLEEITAAFIPGSFYSYKQIKSMLEEIYERLGIGRTPKATDLEKWMECKSTKGIVDDKKENGYKIVRLKI